MTESDPYAITGDFEEENTPQKSKVVHSIPAAIGRYRVESTIAEGGFGVVYLGHDDVLNRRVAIKVPHPELVEDQKQVALYLEEARAVAMLDHANIVPVYDIGTTEQFPCFVVSRYIDGQSLHRRNKAGMTVPEIVQVVATIAKALHFGHQNGIVHRDVKPANILLDNKGVPHLVDYGLALHDRNPNPSFRCAGTPRYMSPEQARGEGHRVDGRSDIFSLGTVYYELLVGRQMFRGKDPTEILHMVKTVDPKPPRQIDDQIPRELERICLKAVARRIQDRYTTALDMADDLCHFNHQSAIEMTDPDSLVQTESISANISQSSPATRQHSAVPDSPTQTRRHQQEARLVPKGLRSFDQHDSEFFLALLPGPRDRNGLPDSVRFWKTRVEETDCGSTFSVGLIYGPSGCGKSSFVKAGLIPQLNKNVTPIYIEATPGETELRLLNRLRKQTRVSTELPLAETIAALRHGDGLYDDEKVLIVIDQFEQWLHSREDGNDEGLVDAIRQCEGGRVQCLVMIRDDFWMAATRFMRKIEVRLADGENSLAIDLFELPHARQVLCLFGQAFSALPQDSDQISLNQQAFIDDAIEQISEEGKVICVRLALFAEMMKARVWEPASLQSVGGVKGVGAAFLENTLSAKTAPPLHRFHQKAARAVLNSLLPDHGANIKGHMRSRSQLQKVSGYADQEHEFTELLRMLDSRLRLITPTDPDGVEGTQDDADGFSYQLAHDYLVPSVRDWLERKQRETGRGRAEIRLTEIAELWNAKPENQRLPTVSEWVRIKFRTQKSSQTPAQQTMMSAARRHYAWRFGVLLIGLISVIWGVRMWSGHLETVGLFDQLLTANIENTPAIIDQLERNHDNWDKEQFEATVGKERARSFEQVRSGLLLVKQDPGHVDSLIDRMLIAPVGELVVIRQRLSECGVDVNERLKLVLDDQEDSRDRRFNAALGIAAGFNPPTNPPTNPTDFAAPILNPHADFITDELVDQMLTRPADAGLRIDILRPLRHIIFDRLHMHFVGDDAIRQRVATGMAREFVTDIPAALCRFVLDANSLQYEELSAFISDHRESSITRMEAELQQSLDSVSDAEQKERLGRRQANAGVTLLKLGEPGGVWPLLKHRADPRTRSWLIQRAAEAGVSPAMLVERFEVEHDLSIRRALLLAIGNYQPKNLTSSHRKLIIDRCHSLACNEPDAGLNAAAEWLLRTWNASKSHAIGESSTIEGQNWYRGPNNQKMVVIDATADVNVGRIFEIGATESTIAQVRKCFPGKSLRPNFDLSDDCPMGLMTWFQAVAYCQWLNEQAGIREDQWCYPRVDYVVDLEFTLVDADLSKTGFRLPTNAEWQFACRAGSETSRFYGESDELLSHYAFWDPRDGVNISPVGSVKPNDFGLFDMYGNLSEWRCTLQSPTQVTVGGGATFDGPDRLRSDYFGGPVPGTKFNSYGFRVARTRPKPE